MKNKCKLKPTLKRGLQPMLKYRRFSKQKNLLTDGSRKIKNTKMYRIIISRKVLFPFSKKIFHF